MSRVVSSRRAWVALVGMVPAVLVVGLDVTVLSVALPTLARDLGASTDQLQWLSMAYSITYAAAIVPSGLLGDRAGRRGVLLGSLAVFVAGSLACALSATAGELIAARALLGVGAAGVATLSTAMVNVLFGEAERGRAMTLIMLVNVVGFPLGPILGGWLLGHVAWGWIFAINVPVAVLGIVAVAWLMPESRASQRPGWDLPGLASLSGAVVALCFGLTQAESEGWTDASVWPPITLGAVLLAVFLRIERATRDPFVPVGLFRRPRFAGGAAAAALMSFVIAGLLFVVPQYTQAVLGASTEVSGLYLLSFAVGMLVAMPLAQAVSSRFGSGVTIGVGMGLLALSLMLAAATTVTTAGWWLVIWAALAGAAFGLGLPVSMALAIGDVPVDASGVGSGVLQSLRQIATAVGTALLGSLLGAGYRAGLPTDLPDKIAATARSGIEQGLAVANQLGSARLVEQVRAAFVDGMVHVAYAGAALSVVSLVAFGIALAIRRARTRQQAPEKADVR